MCGVAGVIGRWDALDATRFRDSASELMRMRGPDSAGAAALVNGRFVDASSGVVPMDSSVLLVHRRLAVLDVSDAGAQPMLAGDGTAALCYNGEIYNYEELALRLGRREWKGQSDTEVLLEWMRARRPIDDLVGMFAFAFVDASRDEALLVRDEYGVKPLFIARLGSALAFASDVRVLLTLPGLPRRPTMSRLVEYLQGGAVSTKGPETAFEGIELLMPGECMRLQMGRREVSKERWAPMQTAVFRGTFFDAKEAVREALVRSVRLHLKSDVQVGAALSGGLDSSAIVCAAHGILGDDASIQAVSHIADAAAYSEESWIDIAAQASGSVVHKVWPRPEEFPADVDDLILSQGEPIASTSVYAQYRVFKAARAAGVTVMLDGQGADELLAGYAHYRAPWLSECLRTGRWRQAHATLAGDYAVGRASASNTIMLLARDYLPAWARRSSASLVGRPALPEWVRIGAGSASRSASSVSRARREGLRSALEHSIATSLQGLLRYEDRNSMRFSIESRVPFLGRDLARLLRSMPAAYLYGPRGESKYVLREAVRGMVPDALVDRRDKIGFENDEVRWLRASAEWAREVVASADAARHGYDSSKLSRALEAVISGRQPALARRVWASLFALRWQQLFRVSIT